MLAFALDCCSICPLVRSVQRDGMMVKTKNVVRLAPPTPCIREATYAVSTQEVVTAVSEALTLESFFFLSQWVTKEE